MSMEQGTRTGRSAEMNVTPLIDVLLVLLIIFMVMQPHLRLGERAEIPQQASKTSVTPDSSVVVVQLRDQGAGNRPSLRVNTEEVAWSDLESRLRQIYEVRADKTAFLTGDADVEFEYVAQAVDISHRAGADRVGLMRDLRQ